MDIAADELLDELARVEATLAEAVRRAGQGCGPDFQRRLDAHVRSLRPMLGEDASAVARDAMEAAQRVMDAADPEAPLLMLALARNHLAALIRRQAASRTLRTAA